MNKEETFAAVAELVKKTNEETMNIDPIEAAEREKTAQWYTDHGGKPTNEKEWADQNFGMGAFYARQGIPRDELREDWPEIFTNKECMKGYRKGWADAVAEGLLWPETFREPNQSLAEISLKFFIDDDGFETVKTQTDLIADFSREEGDMIIRAFTEIVNKYVAKAKAEGEKEEMLQNQQVTDATKAN